MKQHIKEKAALSDLFKFSELPPLEAEDVPVIESEQTRYIHYPASVADIQSILAQLPKGFLNGLNFIAYCFDPYPYEKKEVANTEPDPYTGRLGYETAPGIYVKNILGLYNRVQATIYLSAYVYDEQTLPDRAIWEFYNRMQMLGSLLHEVAHHHDFSTRISRGRGRADNFAKPKLEKYAEDTCFEWEKIYLVSYLEETYPTECSQFLEWLSKHVGIKLSLKMLLDQPERRSSKGSYEPLQASMAIERLARDVAVNKDPLQIRFKFAKFLRENGYSDEANEVVGQFFSDFPDHPFTIEFKGKQVEQ